MPSRIVRLALPNYFASLAPVRASVPRGLTLPPRGLTLLTFLLAVLGPAWPSVAPRVLASLTLLPVMALAWPSGLPWPPRGLTLLTLLPVLAPAWPSVAAAWPYFAHFAFCPRIALRGRDVALLCSLCFLSWPLRELLWPPHGLASPTLNPVLAPAWLSVAPAWPYLLSLLPVLALAWPWPPARLAYSASVFGSWTLAGLLSWPLHGLLRPPCGHTLPFSASSFAPTLCRLRVDFALSVLGPEWHVWPCVALPCLPCFLSRPCVMAFCGLLVAFLHFLSWPLRGPPRPQRGHYLLCCFPHLRHDPLAHGVACVLAASSSFRPA